MVRLLPLVALALLVNLSLAGEPAERPSVADDMQTMQGNWKVAGAIIGPTHASGRTPEFFQKLGDQRLEFKIAEKQLSFACIRSISGEEIALDNDVQTPASEEQFGKNATAQRLIMLTNSQGESLLASYILQGDKLNLRYPAGCCSRSGNVINFERVK